MTFMVATPRAAGGLLRNLLSVCGPVIASLFVSLIVLLPPCCAANADETTTEGIVEKRGDRVPLDARFVDSEGRPVTLGEVITRPTILAFIYFRCAGICPRLLGGIADVVNRMPLAPGKDYGIIALSFDPRDTPEEAAKSRDQYTHLLSKEIAPGDWRFLTGDPSDIDRVTQAVGFNYQVDQDMFIHPAAIIVLSPTGMITQYLYGTSFVPSALELAITRAGQEKVGDRIVEAPQPCFSIEPKGSRIVNAVMALTGLTVLSCAIGFAAFLYFTNPKRKSRRKETRS